MNHASGPQFRAIQSRSMMADQIRETLRTGLRAGRFEAGHIFSIAALTDEYGVSRTPVRDALSRLVAEGVLEDDARGQVRVPVLDLRDYDELIRARCVIEGGAVARAAQIISATDLERIRHLAERHRAFFEVGNIDRTLEANAAFHFALYDVSANPFLIPTIGSLWTRAGPYTRLLSRLVADRITASGLELYSPHHDEILTALARRDEVAAQTAIMADIHAGRDLLRPYLAEMV